MNKKAIWHAAGTLAVLGLFALIFLTAPGEGPPWSTVEVPPRPADTPELLARGKALYGQQCALCHGPDGKGDGPVAATYRTRPRDLTTGKYKLKSTPDGSLPSDADLFRTVTSGVRGTAMRPYAALTPEDRWALVTHLKTLAVVPDEDEEGTVRLFEIRPADPEIRVVPTHPPSPEALARGKALYAAAKCGTCHGPDGKGDGPEAPGLLDDWRFPVAPPDLTRGPELFKRGSAPADVYRVLTTGVPGTPMPSMDAWPEADRWDLAYHVVSLYAK